MNRKVHIYLEIIYDYRYPKKTKIKTNAKKETVEKILEEYLRGQIGAGEDSSESNIKDEYKIAIGLDLTSDTIHTSSDTDNKSLTAGIVYVTLGNLDKIEIVPLGQEEGKENYVL